jgi:hypothetical protein
LKFEVLSIWYSDFEHFSFLLSRRNLRNDKGEGEGEGEGGKRVYYNPTNPKKKKEKKEHIKSPPPARTDRQCFANVATNCRLIDSHIWNKEKR